MLVITQKFIYREDLMSNPDILYVFGDNTEREGYGGQAAEMRDEPNAFGVATKRFATHNSSAYMSDDSDEDLDTVFTDLRKLDDILDSGKYKAVVFPADGLGTGLAQLPKYAPNLLASIEQFIDGLKMKHA